MQIGISAAFSDAVDLVTGPVALAKELMPSLGAEMWYIDNGRRIIGKHGQRIARGQRLQPFAGLQNGQGAKQPDGIKSGVFVSHILQIRCLSQPVHKDVTAGTSDL